MPRVELTPETLLIEYIRPILKRLSDAERELKELQRISNAPILSAVPSEEKLSLNDLDGKTLLVKFAVTKGKLKVYPEEFDLG